MTYSIKQAAEKLYLTVYTIRYYDKEGLLPFLKRSENGIRQFTEHDLEWISLICCLKNTGMQIKDIKEFIQYYVQGDETFEQRRELLLNHREHVLQKMEQLNQNLERIDHKIAYYDSEHEKLKQSSQS